MPALHGAMSREVEQIDLFPPICRLEDLGRESPSTAF
jgi:hypothetical protein